MKIGILQTGLVPDGFADSYGEYDAIFGALMGSVAPEAEIAGYRVVDDHLPASPDEADGWIISGSKHGVYEDHSWIEPLKAFIRDCRDARTPMIGVCFGHQVMADALGGKTEKWEGGWNLGPKTYSMMNLPAWMQDAPEAPVIHAVHQDQVIALPPDATPVMTNGRCDYAALLYGDPEKPYAISIQPHPEFRDDYAEELIRLRHGDPFPAAMCDEALATIGARTDKDWAARWFLRFLQGKFA